MLLPVAIQSLLKAIELNGVAVPFNKNAFALGRLFAHSPAVVESIIAGPQAVAMTEALEDIISHRTQLLTDYQDQEYAQTYQTSVNALLTAEKNTATPSKAWARAAASNLAKLMAYKDEYEVARM